MNSSTPESDRDAPQPLNYASPGIRRSRRVRWFMWMLLSLFVLTILWLRFELTTHHGDFSVREYSASNLRRIGQAILLYTNDHQGEYPDSFQTILLDGDGFVSGAVFVSPARSETPANGSTTRAIAAQMGAGGHVSYIYLGRGLSANIVTPNTIVAYEMIPSPGGGTNVLFGDGHVEFVGPVTAIKISGRARTAQYPVTLPSDGTWGQ